MQIDEVIRGALFPEDQPEQNAKTLNEAVRRPEGPIPDDRLGTLPNALAQRSRWSMRRPKRGKPHYRAHVARFEWAHSACH
jgi:hypothetical protein